MTVPVDGKRLDWPRLVANAINALRVTVDARTAFPFQALAAAPSSPLAGQTYYDTTLGKVRTWAGGVWNDHW